MKQRRVKKGSKSVRTMQGRKQGWTEETAWAKGEAWHTLLEHTGQRREKVLQCPEVLTLASSEATPMSQDCAFSQSPGRTDAICTCQYETGLFKNGIYEFLTFRASPVSTCGRKH